MRPVGLVPGGYYHVFNRGVDKRPIFNDLADFQRFYESMYLFSDANYENPRGDFIRNAVELSGHTVLKDIRNPHVRILSFCLLPNHFHLFLQQVTEEGVSIFLHKLQKTYSWYFNDRIRRSGTLFEGTFRAVPVLDEAHFFHLPRYIHLNALDKPFPEWRENELDDWAAALIWLDSYEWSSHHVFAGRNQELPLVDEAFARAMFPNPDAYISFLKDWAGRPAIPIELADQP